MQNGYMSERTRCSILHNVSYPKRNSLSSVNMYTVTVYLMSDVVVVVVCVGEKEEGTWQAKETSNDS